MAPSKGLSLPGNYYEHPNAYWDYRNRDYAKSLQGNGFRVVRLWTAMKDTFPAAGPTNYADACAYFSAPGSFQQGQFDFFDDVIHAANQDGVLVIMCLGHQYPSWINGATGPDPLTGKPADWKLPADNYLAQNQPWDWWVSYIYNRYRFQSINNLTGYVNPAGPNPNNQFGNKYGAWIWFLEPFNEPNYFPWQYTRQSSGDVTANNTHCTVGKMMQTLDALISWWGPACGVLAPSITDIDTSDSYSIDFRTYGQRVLAALQNWRPNNYFAWSHHNYTDIEHGKTSTASGGGTRSTFRVEDVIYDLGNLNWRGGGDRDVYITEGGYRLGGTAFPSSTDQAVQSKAIQDAWNFEKNLPQVKLFSNHALNMKAGSPVASALRGTLGPVGTPAQEFTAASTFRNMA